MSDLTLILLAAGDSRRFQCGVKKQWLRIGDEPLWQFVTNRFIRSKQFAEVIITAHPEEAAYMRLHGNYHVVSGGSDRQSSLGNALAAVKTPYVMVTDVARGCIDAALIARLIAERDKADCIVPALGVHDTVTFHGETIDRGALLRIQTPQLSKTDVLKAALATNETYTDESSAIVAAGGSRHFVEGDEAARKLTTLADLRAMACFEGPAATVLTGNGLDVHAFDTEGSMVLGGVAIDHPVGFKAHSDGDVAIHALIDALLGAAGMGDIGMLFPDTDDTYKGIDSAELLETVVMRLKRYGFGIVNADITIAAQTPRLSPYKEAMRQRLGTLLGLPPVRVGVKATTTEKLGFVGRKEGVAVIATATINYMDWTQL
ncbi:bifunctional 2-C-methyl-D-erythritol 4-phosphate cytidylyltransferase/2-C-methyl-D-erythritol 2,4-cyclodiphosphate synthase [Sulfurimonas sp. HSL-3221]|uniref:bifunctional 2-C-methyl-D-erythritol 4-phosphate cytidylyltransferase/2-C-methyl-D-erythritol 2,4-cyclodiphosphate synthase n=1 Tax=Sulfurimonadaceae TaxID=2771471 RepID=UPI001E55425E|nr:bifunctional 2-C-methyl-D-erythritol 4-phosphate cytidylyltransferase/2-C-methyl-D-erythritol 2,4-cyclodiphosphate synthase [Sulfurimonas sp. HSL-3221]UFS61988.1 bifunctional 2-C-methyl-D-erythritol 4-phosphate cytidylyltransferase/2-C-methyl-D-erythritol 2,4-cyclodiphosphate synthase [Sulfurimonas sp. HSL-3221]